MRVQNVSEPRDRLSRKHDPRSRKIPCPLCSQGSASHRIRRPICRAPAFALRRPVVVERVLFFAFSQPRPRMNPEIATTRMPVGCLASVASRASRLSTVTTLGKAEGLTAAPFCFLNGNWLLAIDKALSITNCHLKQPEDVYFVDSSLEAARLRLAAAKSGASRAAS